MATEQAETKKSDDQDTPRVPPPVEQTVTTSHRFNINGQEVAYTATAGTYVLREEDEKEGTKAKASVFYVAYTQDDGPDRSRRPVTFSFNGGPGSPSVWLHLGLLGPRRVWLDDQGEALPPPYRLVDNEFSLLDATDLVFIDPVSTGYSRAVPGEKPKQFHEFKKDIESVGEFIRLYVTRNQRWSSPKFLIGESYGTTRAAGLSGFLQKEYGLFLNGIMLVSAILNFQTAYFHPGNDLPAILFLPTYAATAWYHQRLGSAWPDLPALLREVEAFAAGEYATALMQGDKISAETRQHILAQLHRFTSLSPDYLDRNDLRINIFRFVKELVRDQRRTIGRLDTRFLGIDRDAVGAEAEDDPSYTNIQGAYTATLNDYMRRELRFESDLPYEILTDKVWPWNYEKFQNQYVDVADTLREALSQNRHLKVFVANGYYDLATPYFATEYTFSHLGLDPSLADNIAMRYYPARHMMYIHQPSLAQMRQDLLQFMQSAVA